MKKNNNYFLKVFWFATLNFIGAMFNVDNFSDTQNCYTSTNTFTHIFSPVKQPVQSITYKTDTISEHNSALLSYCNGKIVRYYKEGDNKFKMQLPYFAHENWHHHNAQLKYRSNENLSPDEFLKLCVWNEISANICAILTARFEYIYADDKDEIIKRYENTYMKFYFKEIKSGKIVPDINYMSSYERYVLLNGTRDMWFKRYWAHYKPTMEKMLSSHFMNYQYKNNKPSPYYLLRKGMLTIGGVDFDRYLRRDISPESYYVSEINDISKVALLQDCWPNILCNLDSNRSYLQKLPEKEQKDFVYNIVVSEKMKQMLKNADLNGTTNNKQILSEYYDIISSLLNKDSKFKQWLNNYETSFSLYSKTDDIAHKRKLYDIYKCDSINILDSISNYAEHATTPMLKQSRPSLATLFIAQKQLKSQSEPEKNNTHHMSGPQYIDLPNFDEPILLKLSEAQSSQIQDMIQSFADIPKVLKECDTTAQKAYLNKLNENSR